jgi:hypothetical protein
MATMNRIIFATGLTFTASLYLFLPCNAEEVVPHLVGVDELVSRILANDLELLALRGEVRKAQADVKEMDTRRDPELRLGYSRSGDRAVPGPYTETLSENVIQRTRLSNQRSGTSSQSGFEQRSDGTGSETRELSASRNFQQSLEQIRTETSRSTTIREITPTRSGEQIHEVYTETRESRRTESGREQDNYQEFQNQQSASGTNLLSVNGNLSGNEEQAIREREVITRESFSERHYGYDPYEGGDQYSVELRFTPVIPGKFASLYRPHRQRFPCRNINCWPVCMSGK